MIQRDFTSQKWVPEIIDVKLYNYILLYISYISIKYIYFTNRVTDRIFFESHW